MANKLAIDGGFDLPFHEQIDFFRKKINLPTANWDDIWQSAHDRAFVVAAAAKADLLNDLRRAVDKAISTGTTLETFRSDFRKIVADHGWQGWTGDGSAAGFAWRTKVIYETNLRSSYAAGRWAQLNDPNFQKLMPYWEYIHNDSVLNPRPLHLAWNHLTLPATHEFWKTHFPPNGWGCRCRVVARSKPKADAPTEPPAGWDQQTAKGTLPGLDRGWGYAPGASNVAELKKIAAEKVKTLPKPLAQSFADDVSPAIDKWWDSSTASGRWHDAAFADAPDFIKQKIKQAGDPPALLTTPGAHPHCTWGKLIEMDGAKDSSASGQSTWRHEYGHWVDGKLAEGRRYISQGEAFQKAMENDAKTMISGSAVGRESKSKAVRIGIMEQAYRDAAQSLANSIDKRAWLAERFSAVGIDFPDVESAMSKHTVFPQILSGDVLHGRYAKIAVALNIGDAQGLMDAITGRGQWAEVSATFGKGVVGTLSDLFGSATKNKVGGFVSGWGHSTAYYNRAEHMQAVECYANIFCLCGEGGIFWKRTLELLTPSMLKVFLSA